MSEFKPGEIAIFVGSGKHHSGPTFERECPFRYGDELEIIGLSPSSEGERFYLVKIEWPCPIAVAESSLRKRRPPEQYKDQFKPCTKDFNWREPVKGEVVA